MTVIKLMLMLVITTQGKRPGRKEVAGRAWSSAADAEHNEANQPRCHWVQSSTTGGQSAVCSLQCSRDGLAGSAITRGA